MDRPVFSDSSWMESSRWPTWETHSQQWSRRMAHGVRWVLSILLLIKTRRKGSNRPMESSCMTEWMALSMWQGHLGILSTRIASSQSLTAKQCNYLITMTSSYWLQMGFIGATLKSMWLRECNFWESRICLLARFHRQSLRRHLSWWILTSTAMIM